MTTALGNDAAGLRLAQQVGGRTCGISLVEIVMVFDASLANRERVEGYLAWKWGIQAKLPTAHAYRSNSPGASAVVAPAMVSGSVPPESLALLLDAGDSASYTGSCTLWTDISGSAGRNGTLTNEPTFLSSPNAVVFDGVSDYVAGAIPQSVFQGAHTISCWFYRTANSGQFKGLFNNGCTFSVDRRKVKVGGLASRDSMQGIVSSRLWSLFSVGPRCGRPR